MNSGIKAFMTGMILMSIFIGGMTIGKYFLQTEYNLIEPVEKTIEIPIEIYVDIDIVNELNQLNIDRWNLSYSFNGNYSLIVIIDDNFSTSIHDVTLEEIYSFMKYVKEIQYKLGIK